MLQVLLLLAAMHANAIFKALFDASHLLRDTSLYGYVYGSYINFNQLL